MQHFDYLIIGGGAAGTSAAETLRSKDPHGSIGIVDEEPHPLYSRVMLSKPEWFLGRIGFDHIWMRKEEWYKEKNIIRFPSTHAVKLDPASKTVLTDKGEELQYGKLLLALGTAVRHWSIPGADKKGIHYLRTLEDGQKIIEHLKSAKNVVTVGGGFISFEMDDLFRMANLPVTHLLRESYYWEPLLDRESGQMIEAAMEKGGVKIIRNVEATEVLGGENCEELKLSTGEVIPADMIMCGIGASSTMGWLEGSGLKTGHGIIADEYLHTNLPDVWTAGDVAEFKDLILNETIQLGNWVNASEHGRIAATNMTGTQQAFNFVSFYTTQGFGISIAFAGDIRVLPGRTVIQRGSPASGSYMRIILDGKEVEGATMINRTSELTIIAKIIRLNIDVSKYQAELANPDFDLKKLVPA